MRNRLWDNIDPHSWLLPGMPQDASCVSLTAPKGSLILDNLHIYRLNFITSLALRFPSRCTAMFMFIGPRDRYVDRFRSLLLSRHPNVEGYCKDILVRVDVAKPAEAGGPVCGFPGSEVGVQEKDLGSGSARAGGEC